MRGMEKERERESMRGGSRPANRTSVSSLRDWIALSTPHPHPPTTN